MKEINKHTERENISQDNTEKNREGLFRSRGIRLFWISG